MTASWCKILHQIQPWRSQCKNPAPDLGGAVEFCPPQAGIFGNSRSANDDFLLEIERKFTTLLQYHNSQKKSPAAHYNVYNVMYFPTELIWMKDYNAQCSKSQSHSTQFAISWLNRRNEMNPLVFASEPPLAQRDANFENHNNQKKNTTLICRIKY